MSHDTRPRKRSLVIAGHKTSISLEDAFWASLKEISNVEGRSTAALIEAIDKGRGEIGLSSAVRLYVLDYYRSRYFNNRSSGR